MDDEDRCKRMGRRTWLSRAGWAAGIGAAAGAAYAALRNVIPTGPYADVERKLVPLCETLGPPGPNDWLAEHKDGWAVLGRVYPIEAGSAKLAT